jgi:hypothetical protein
MTATEVPASASERETYSPDDLVRRAIERRAIEAVNWGMPIVNFDRIYQAAVKAGAGFNQIVYWSGLNGWKTQLLTTNPDLIYLVPFFDTKEAGPMVLEIPPAGDEGAINGTIMDVWQVPLEDVGPAGLDKGAGGKYLFLPPGYNEPIPDGYNALHSSTYEGYALLRSVLKTSDAAGVKRAVDYGLKIKFYPLSQVGNSPETKRVDALGKVFDATIQYDLSLFESIDRIVQYEPWLTHDKVMVDMLRTVGIVKGKPFAPDAKTQEILESAVAEAHEWLYHRFETDYAAFFDNRYWFFPAAPELLKLVNTEYEDENAYEVDARGLLDTWGFSMVKYMGRGQFYLMTFKDTSGDHLDGSENYKLTVPADVPVTGYWSAVVYNRATHTLVREASSVTKSSQMQEMKVNADGTVDLYYGPEAPAGKEANWTPTNPGGRFEVLFRLYGPQKPLFDKTWVLPDVEKLS